MTRNEAIKTLSDAVARCYTEKVKTAEVREALRTLKPLCRERWPLDWFWDSADTEHDIGRDQNLRAAMNAILRGLG